MKMQENMIYSQENRNRFRDNTLEIADKDFKTPIINMLHVPKDEKLSERYSQMVSLDFKNIYLK